MIRVWKEESLAGRENREGREAPLVVRTIPRAKKIGSDPITGGLGGLYFRWGRPLRAQIWHRGASIQKLIEGSGEGQEGKGGMVRDACRLAIGPSLRPQSSWISLSLERAGSRLCF